MKTLTDRLSHYAAYHRDPRNIATHFVGIPMILVGVSALLARPSLLVAGVPVSPALVATLATSAFYFAMDRRFAVGGTAFLGVSLALGTWLASQSTAAWLGGSLGLFVVGWIIQFVGHAFEGKKPAFADDLVGLLVGPLFLVAEVAFMLGLGGAVQREVEERVGPVAVRDERRAA